MIDDAYERYDAERWARMKKHPICDLCGEYIADKYYDIAGLKVCPDCIDNNRRWYDEDADTV